MKNYVLDTNILISNAFAFYCFEDNNVFIPLTVIKELDDIKGRKADVAVDARSAIRALNELIADHNPLEPIRLDSGGYFQVLPEANGDSPDERIINSMLNLESPVLVSNDVNARIMAKSKGVDAEPFEHDNAVKDADHLPRGIFYFRSHEMYYNLNTDGIKQGSCGKVVLPIDRLPEDIHVNAYLVCEDDDYVARVVDVVEEEDGIIYATLESSKLNGFMKRRIAGIMPRSSEQAVALDALMNRDLDVVVLTGDAGCGKTLLAVAAACEMVKGKKGHSMEEVIFSRTMDSNFKEIGFLPGSEAAKTMPWLLALEDNLKVIHRASGNDAFSPKEAIFASEDSEKAFFFPKALNFMRGRSITRTVFILDESQNLNAKQIKTLLSRAGEDCKIIILGNLEQIDNEYVSARSSGLTRAASRFAVWEKAAVIHLENVERSDVAEFVNNYF